MNDRAAVSQLLARARQRCFTNLVLEQCVLALAIAMGGAILLLLIGTELLDWYWIALLTVLSLGAGIYRLRKTVPSTYRLAQQIDRRLSLADALSTATYFATADRGEPAIRERQREEADSIARTIEPNIAVPFRRPRYAVYAIALTAVACGMFALRYAVVGSLSLQPSMVKIAFDTFFPPQTQVAKAKQPQDKRRPPMDQGDPDSPTTQSDQQPDTPLDAQNEQEQNNTQAADKSKEAAEKGKQEEQAPDQQGDNADKGDKQQNGNDADQQNQQNGSKDGKQAGKQDSKQGTQSENSSLMDKLKDAMSNMMNKMKSPSKDSQPQSAQNQKSQQDKSSQQNKQGQQQKQENASADAQSDQQQTNSGDPKQSADAKNGEKSSDKNASDDSKSGIGSADGDKSAKEAAQLQAMGKISEIIGKRAQNVTGEVMVEVGQSKQQLKTPWAQRQAQHAEAGSEVHRDEVPLAYQQFVQQYFEEIRKGADTKPKNQ